MRPRRSLLPLVLACALAATGCAFVPRDNLRLDEALAAERAVTNEAQIEHLVPHEMRAAREALERAAVARGTLQDPAEIDHLAYVAKQRFAIAREKAALRMAQDALAQSPSP